MAQNFAAFVAQATQLQTEGDNLHMERKNVASQLRIANEQVKSLRIRLQDIDKRIIDNKESKQAMMKGTAEPHVAIQTPSHTVNSTRNYETDDQDAEENIIVAPRNKRSTMSASEDGDLQSLSSTRPRNSQAQIAATCTLNADPVNASTPNTLRKQRTATFDTSHIGSAARAHLWNLGNSYVINEKYSTVVSIDHIWTEISCKICGCNSKVNSPSIPRVYFGGIIGLYNHIIYHRAAEFKDSPKPALEVVVKNCFKMRKLSHEDVALIKTGKVPLVKIPLRARGDVNQGLIDEHLNVVGAATDENVHTADPGQKGTKRANGKKGEEYRGSYDEDDEEELPVIKRQRRS